MEFYNVIGLQRVQHEDSSYITNEKGRILRDENGVGLAITRTFDHDTLFVQRGDTYYAIHLFLTHSASFKKRASLCKYGHMDVQEINAAYPAKKMTHVPLQKDLAFQIRLPIGICDFENDIEVYSCAYLSDPDPEWSPRPEWIFQFSHHGGDETVPHGFAEVNMDLFCEIPPQVTYMYHLPRIHWTALLWCS